MLAGTAQLEQLIAQLPTIRSWKTDPVQLENVEILHIQYELPAAQIEELLPPALHPTLPPLGHWSCWDVPESPWGRFHLVQFRLSCRSGARPRVFLLGAAIDNEDARDALGECWGFSATDASIDFVRSYDAARFRLTIDGHEALAVELRDPESLQASDLQFFASMHGAHTPNGLRLVQFDPSYEVSRAERYRPQIAHIESDTWQRDDPAPVYAVTGWGANASINLPTIRFACNPDVDAFRGTETIKTP